MLGIDAARLRSWRSAVRLHTARAMGRPVVAHHGLQRSGTNFLARALYDLGIPVANLDVIDRASPAHKHFRWNRDKATIPPAIAHQFGNDAQAQAIDEVNHSARFPKATRHLVMQKPEAEALASMCNWGRRVDWFAGRHEALAALPAFQADYHAYYAFWREMAHASPDRVVVLDLATAAATLPDVLVRLGFRPRATATPAYDDLPHSPAKRLTEVTADDVRTALGL